MPPLRALQAKLAANVRPNLGLDDARIAVVETHAGVAIEFYGSPFDEPFDWLCEAVSSDELAASITELKLRSPEDEGTNGTRCWDIEGLLRGSDFPRLRTFAVERNVPGNHNRIIVGTGSNDENGMLGRLLDKAPALSMLEVPSAPNFAFFEGPLRPSLRHLNVDAGYSHQGFVRNLASSSRFPALSTLEYGDFAEDYLDDYPSQTTPLEDYELLFRSEAFRNVRQFVLRNPPFDASTAAVIRAIRSERSFQMRLDKWSSRYI